MSLSKGVVVVGTDVADHGVMDGAATVAEVLKPRLKLLSPSKSVDVGTVAAEGTLIRDAVFAVPRRWLQRKRRKQKKLSHELACNTNSYVCMHGMNGYYYYVRMSK